MSTSSIERQHLKALLEALEEPVRASSLPVDDPLLIRVARHHRLTPLLSILCRGDLPRELAEICRRDRLATAARTLVLRRAAEECIRALAPAGVATIVLKGLDYETRLYDAPGARPTADIDLLVPGDKRRVAFQVLDRLGFEPRACAPGFDEPDYHEVAWTRAGTEVDLHMALAPLVRCRIDYAAVWAAAEAFHLGETETRVLSRPHAAVFQTLHMSIDHFAIPAVYLVELARLLADPDARRAAETTAQEWRCDRPFATGTALTKELLPRATADWQPTAPARWSRRVIEAYGDTAPLPRVEQLIRKFSHFDTVEGAVLYFAVQSRRNVRERFERGVRRRSARARLALPTGDRAPPT